MPKEKCTFAPSKNALALAGSHGFTVETPSTTAPLTDVPGGPGNTLRPLRADRDGLDHVEKAIELRPYLRGLGKGEFNTEIGIEDHGWDGRGGDLERGDGETLNRALARTYNRCRNR
jgi:hypothetical protein